MQLTTSDILAKLLANENIFISRGNVQTASFDIKDRVLTLPVWASLQEPVEEMLILHEVGHALFSTPDGYLKYVNGERHLGDYMNVVEDVRIERKMKERYPGSRKSFFQGYQLINESDFFKVKDKTPEQLSKYSLIDRINLYYKVGIDCGVSFSDSEKALVDQVVKCDTEEQVYLLAKQIYELDKHNAREQIIGLQVIVLKNKTPKEEYLEDETIEIDPNIETIIIDERDDFSAVEDPSDNDESEDDSKKYGQEKTERSSDSTSSRIEKDGKSTEPSDGVSSGITESEIEKMVEDYLQAKTYSAVEESLKSTVDANITVKYYDLAFKRSFIGSPIVPCKDIIEIFNDHVKKYHYTLDSGKTSPATNKVISHIVKEFEMKKSATNYKFSQSSKSGRIDVNKLYAYKLKDDLFKQITKMNDGKKHGLLFLLDWSGSMSKCIANTLNQLYSLAIFCRRVNIPFQILAFTDQYTLLDLPKDVVSPYEVYRLREKMIKTNENGIGFGEKVKLLELFNHKMSNTEFTSMISFFSTFTKDKKTLPQYLSLGGTPLNESLMIAADYIGKFIRENSVEKMTFITLTDGDGGRIIPENMSKSYYGHKNINVMTDKITKRQYLIPNDASAQTKVFLDVIRDRYKGIKILGFYLIPDTSSLWSFCTSHMQNLVHAELNVKYYQIKKIIKDKGFYIEKNLHGRDEFYLLTGDSLYIEESDLNGIDQDSSTRQIASTFKKAMNTDLTSRLVLNKFVDQII